MRPLIAKSVASVAIALASLPALAMDSLVIERFYIQNQEPLNIGHASAREPSLQRVSEDTDNQHKYLQEIENKRHDNLRLHDKNRTIHINK